MSARELRVEPYPTFSKASPAPRVPDVPSRESPFEPRPVCTVRLVRLALVGDTHSTGTVRPAGTCRAPAIVAARCVCVRSAASTNRGWQAPLTSPARHATRPSQARLVGAPRETRETCHTHLAPILKCPPIPPKVGTQSLPAAGCVALFARASLTNQPHPLQSASAPAVARTDASLCGDFGDEPRPSPRTAGDT